MGYTGLLVVVSNRVQVVGSGTEVLRFSQEPRNNQLHGRRKKEVGAIRKKKKNSRKFLQNNIAPD